MSENRKTAYKITIFMLAIFLILSILAIIILISIYNQGYISKEKEKTAYCQNSITLYAGPGNDFAKEESVSGYFQYEEISNNWMKIYRQNDDGEKVIRYANLNDVDSWGEYVYETRRTSLKQKE